VWGFLQSQNLKNPRIPASRVSKWRKGFANLRLAGLEDEQRSGRRVKNDEKVERRILDQLAKAPLQGFARWNGRLVAEALGDFSVDAVSRKASEIVGL